MFSIFSISGIIVAMSLVFIALVLDEQKMDDGLGHITIESFDEWAKTHDANTDITTHSTAITGIIVPVEVDRRDEPKRNKVCALEVQYETVSVEPDFDEIEAQDDPTWDIWCYLSEDKIVTEKVAAEVLSAMTAEEILEAVKIGDEETFRNVKGVGPKRAARIVAVLAELL